jgi:hypothetical protein
MIVPHRGRRRPWFVALCVVIVNVAALGVPSGSVAAPDGPAGPDAASRASAFDPADARTMARTAAIDRIRTLAERAADRFAGLSTRGPDDVTINLVTGVDPGPALAEMDRLAGAAGITLKRLHRRYSLRDLTAVRDDVARRAAAGGSGITAYGIDPDTNSVEVGGGRQPTGVGAAAEVRAAFGDRVTVVDVPAAQLAWGRFNDSYRFYAGNRLTAGGKACTGAFTMTNEYGQTFAITAGHCWGPGTSISAARADDRAYTYFGGVHYRRLGAGHYDHALIGIDRFAGRMWAGAALGDDASRSLPVHDAVNSCDGCQVWFNGSVTGMVLANVYNVPDCQEIRGYSMCGLQGAWSVNSRQLCIGGDSGGPVFAYDGRGGVVAVGIITAKIDDAGTLCLYTRIPPILVYWNSRITTG